MDIVARPSRAEQLKVWSRASADRDTKTLVDDQPEGLQQEVKGVAAEPTAKRVGGTHLSGKADGSPRPAERQQLLPDREPSPATSHDEAGRGREARRFENEDEYPMGSYRRAALAGVQEGGQVVEVDLPPVPRQDSACSTHTFEHRTGQRRVGFLA
jgi:hypothetical protein